MDSKKQDKDQKKKGGFLAGLLSRLSGGADVLGGEAGLGGGAQGGFGALGGVSSGFGRAGLFGGLMATKAGVVALALIGTSVAGGLGYLGWKAFGPGPADRLGGSYQLFSRRPNGAASSSAAGAPGSEAAGGSQSSLKMLAKANAGAESPAAPAAPQAAARGERGVAAPVGKAHNNNANIGGNKAAMLKGPRFGQLKLPASKSIAMSGPNASAPSGHASESSRAVGVGRAAALGGRRASVGRAFGGGLRNGAAGAFRQLGQANTDSVGAGNMRTAGATFDGGAASGGAGQSPGALGGAGTGAGSGPGATPPGNPGSATDASPRFASSIPSASGTNVTPWQSAITLAMALVGACAGLLLLSDKLKLSVSQKWIQYAIAGLVVVLSMLVIALGAAMSQPPYGQKFQGEMFVLAGGAMIAAAAAKMWGLGNPAPAAPAAGATGSAGAATGSMSTPTLIMYACGAAGLAAAMGGFLKPGNKIDSSFFQNGKPPDVNLFGAYHVVVPGMPSEKALERFV
ncbi:MAG: hypothetical protein KGO96_10020 [Elusimicrobia bacterium]|nr:hypothetical protein [Elusimicrobiota bacterium]MDE2426226.1 hypothetical protein [Elusimicrobiota bacterium]